MREKYYSPQFVEETRERIIAAFRQDVARCLVFKTSLMTLILLPLPLSKYLTDFIMSMRLKAM